MTRRKTSLSCLALLAALSHFLLSHSNSFSVPSPFARRPPPHSVTLATRSREYSVLANDDGVPKLEAGDSPAKDPRVLVDGPVPTLTPQPVLLPPDDDPQAEIIDPPSDPKVDDVKHEPVLETLPTANPIVVGDPDDDPDDELGEHFDEEPHLDASPDLVSDDSNPPPAGQSAAEEDKSKPETLHPDEPDASKPKTNKQKKKKPETNTQKKKKHKTNKQKKKKLKNKKPKVKEPQAEKPTTTKPPFQPDKMPLAASSDEKPSAPNSLLSDSTAEPEVDAPEYTTSAADQDVSDDAEPDSPAAPSKPSASPSVTPKIGKDALDDGKIPVLDIMTTAEPSAVPVSLPIILSDEVGGKPSPDSKPGTETASPPEQNQPKVPTPTATAIALGAPTPSGEPITIGIPEADSDEAALEDNEVEPESSWAEDLPDNADGLPLASKTPAPIAIIPKPTFSPGVEKGASTSASPPDVFPKESSETNTEEEDGAGGDPLDLAPPPASSGSIVDASYSCITFGGEALPNFSAADAEFFAGNVSTYKAKQADFPNLPVEFLSHVFGASWSYSLPLEDGFAYDLVLGFAEVFSDACASGSDAAYRVFEISVGGQPIEVDVMASVGCGAPLEQLFNSVTPTNGKILLSLEGVTQKAMLSTVCYRKTEQSALSPSPSSEPSSVPVLIVTEPTAAPLATPNSSPSLLPAGGQGPNQTPSSSTVKPGAGYTCVNFGPKAIDKYELYDPASIDGETAIYKGSGVSANPTLEPAYRYHVYGKKWTYKLKVSTNLPQTVVLGFAEVFPKACASGASGSFRVFTVAVGWDLGIVDVMKSAGCGSVYQTAFRDVVPVNEVIDVSLNAVSGNAMLSVLCYTDSQPSKSKDPAAGEEDIAVSNPTSGEALASSPEETPDEDGPHVDDNTGAPALKDSTQASAYCFKFGDAVLNGFTNVMVSGLEGAPTLYSGGPSSMMGDGSAAEVYWSHVYGAAFSLSVDVGNQSPTTLVLGFAEVYEPACQENFRVFTVQAGPISQTVDVYKEVGCNAVYNLTLTNILPNSGGQIDIVFKAVKNFAMVSTVCVQGVADGDTSSIPSLVILPQPATPEDDSLADDTGGDDTGGDTAPLSTSPPLASAEPMVPADSAASSLPNQGEGTPSSTEATGEPSGSPLPKVNGLIDASITASPDTDEPPPTVIQPGGGSDSGADGADSADDQKSDVELLGPGLVNVDFGEQPKADEEADMPKPSDSLLPSDFTQTTLGEEPEEREPSAFGSDLLSQSPAAFLAEGDQDVENKQTTVTIVGSPSPGAPGVVIEGSAPGSGAATPTAASTNGNAEPGPSAEPAPGVTGASPSPVVAILPNASPQPPVTALPPGTPDTSSTTQTATVTPTPDDVGRDEVLPPVDGTPTVAPLASPPPSGIPVVTLVPSAAGTPDGSEILPPVDASPGPQGSPDGPLPEASAASSPPPSASISQNQIIIVPSPSAQVQPTRTPTPVTSSVSPRPTQFSSSDDSGSGIGAPDGIVSQSETPSSGSPAPANSALPDVVTNPTPGADSTPGPTPSSSRPSSPIGSGQVIVDSPTSAPSPDPAPSIPVAAPPGTTVEVPGNTTDVIEVTGNAGANGDENVPSILQGEYKELIATTPMGNGFAIGMGILGSLLVILLLVCLFFAIFRSRGGTYSYSSNYSAHKPSDYDQSQGGYTDDLGLGGPGEYGNQQGYGTAAQDGYGGTGATFDSRPDRQNESFGFEMPAAGGLGAPQAATYGNTEPDTFAEYASLNLQQASGYDPPETRDNEFRGSQAATARYDSQPPTTEYRASHATRAGYGESQAANTGDYNFTDTFTMTNTGYTNTQRNQEYDEYRDPGPDTHGTRNRASADVADSFNDRHSIARPMKMTSESSGNQERKVATAAAHSRYSSEDNEARAEQKDSSLAGVGTMVDDVGTSQLDSNEHPSSRDHSMSSNPVPAQSPYETNVYVDVADSDSGNVEERYMSIARTRSDDVSVAPLQQQRVAAEHERVDTELSADSLFDNNRADAAGVGGDRAIAGQTADALSQVSNDGPWPWWWSDGNQREPQQRASGDTEGKSMVTESYIRNDLTEDSEGKENSSRQSNSVTTPDFHEDSPRANGGVVFESTVKPSNQVVMNGGSHVVSDTNWRRQYSSPSDEEESNEDAPNPYFDELRRRRQPYVKSVANRLSTGPGSFSMSESGESVLEQARRAFEESPADHKHSADGHISEAWVRQGGGAGVTVAR